MSVRSMRRSVLRFAPALRRTAWSFVDQAVSSTTNFALGLIAARTLAPDDFGAFGLGFITYLFCLNVIRALCSDPLVVRHSASAGQDRAAAIPGELGAVVLLSAAAGTACIVAGAILPGAVGVAFLAFGVALPGTLVQDAWRYIFFAEGRPRKAAINDLAWAVAQAAAMGAVIVTGHASLFALTVAWGAAAWAAALFGFLQSPLRPSMGEARGWLRTNADLGVRYVGDVLAIFGTALVGTFGLGLLAGLGAVAAIRAAQIVLGPLSFLFLGGWIVIVPEGARLRVREPARLPRALDAYSLVLAIVSIGYLGATLALLGGDLGPRVLGDNWSGAQTVLVPTGLLFTFNGLAAGGMAGLRILGAAKEALIARVLVAAATLAATLAGAVLGGAFGFALAGAISAAAGAFVFRMSFRSAFVGPGQRIAEQGP